jgi:hypothetical protein
MTISHLLKDFYIKNNFPKDGGESKDFFELKFKLFTLRLPNSQFRKKVIHIHDIQHVLYNCDTTWKGEAFIAGWEISTKMWKHFPIGIMSLWAMGFSLLNYPIEVYKGYKAGINNKGIIDLDIEKATLLNLTIPELKTIIQKEKTRKVNWFKFLLWCFNSLLVLIFPIIILVIILFYSI